MRDIKGYLQALKDFEQLLYLQDRGMGMLTVDMAVSLLNKLRRDAHGISNSSKPKQSQSAPVKRDAKEA